MRIPFIAGSMLLILSSFDSNHLASANTDPANAAAQALVVSDVSVNKSTGEFSFTLKNSSAKPILGFTLLIVYTYSDGARISIPFSVDYTTTLPLVGKVVAAPVDAQIGPVQPQRSVPFHLTIGSGTDHGSIKDASPLPVVALFDDNSVAGDAARARTDFFLPHQTLASEYQDYIRGLKRIISSPQLKTELETIRRKYAGSGSPPNLPGADGQMGATALRNGYHRIVWDLDALISRLNRQTRPASEILSSYILEAEAMRAAYSAHSTQAVPRGVR